MTCHISKSKLILCEYNAFYFSEIAFIGFAFYVIKQCTVFLGTPGTLLYFEVQGSGGEVSSTTFSCYGNFSTNLFKSIEINY